MRSDHSKQVRFMLLHVLTTAVAKIQRLRVFNVRPVSIDVQQEVSMSCSSE